MKKIPVVAFETAEYFYYNCLITLNYKYIILIDFVIKINGMSWFLRSRVRIFFLLRVLAIDYRNI